MKKNVLVLLLTLNMVTVFGQQQTLFRDKNYTETIALSKTEKKPLVIFFYATWCPHCNMMKREVFTDSTVTAFYRKNFVLMAVDATATDGQKLRAKFQDKFKVNNFPTYVFLDDKETLLYCTSGELKKEDFITEGKNVLVPENQLPNIKNSFENDVTNPDKCLKYITTLRKAGIDATPIAQRYLKTRTQEEKFTDLNWRIFSNGINDFDTEEFKFVVQNKEAFSKAISPTRVDKKIAYTVTESLKPFLESVDTINYDKKRLIAETFHLRKIDSLLYRFDIQIVSQTTNSKKYQKITSENVEKFSWNDPLLLYDICNTYYETINDKKGLLLAANWGKHLLSLGETIDRYIVVSKLLLKLKDHKQAMEFANKGKAFADSLGLKNEEINTVLAAIKKGNL